MQPEIALALTPIAADVRNGLTATPKSLPAKLFYDEAGSRLFDRITELPEYYLTATERAIFQRHAAEMVAFDGDQLSLVELGAGSAGKTAVLLAALCRRQQRVRFHAIDVSSAALDEARRNLQQQLPAVEFVPHVFDFMSDARTLPPISGRKLVLFIGSSIGNFEPLQASLLLRRIRSALAAGDALLLGVDMRKPADVLLPAYDDPQRVTAAFNKNVLARINRELGADFDLPSFAHRIVWNDRESRIEMHLESRKDQLVRIPALALEIAFRRGERIHTENSYKYTLPMLQAIVANGGLGIERTWSDARGWFTVHLLRPSASSASQR